MGYAMAILTALYNDAEEHRREAVAKGYSEYETAYWHGYAHGLADALAKLRPKVTT